MALAVSEQIGPQGPRLTELGQTAFLQAMNSSVLVLAIVIVAIWSPGRDGQQLRIVRRLISARSSGVEGRHRA